MTIEEVAKTMHVGLKTVYRWVNAGKLPAARVGYKTFRVFESDLIKFLRSNMTSGRKK